MVENKSSKVFLKILGGTLDFSSYPPVYPGVTGAHLQGRLPNDTPVQLLDVGGNGRVNTANGDPLIPVYPGGCVLSPLAVLASREAPEVKLPPKGQTKMV